MRGAPRIFAEELVEIADLEQEHAVYHRHNEDQEWMRHGSGKILKASVSVPGYACLRSRYCCTIGVKLCVPSLAIARFAHDGSAIPGCGRRIESSVWIENRQRAVAANLAAIRIILDGLV
jgi:hypothetical protein